ncbi:hypothetical protein Lal_00038094 [Lupinus albus]|nr:hypothetical protein Lal_00038094 [Lupinus albus]
MSPIQCAPEVVRRPCVVSSPINSAAIIFIVVVRLYGDKCWKSFTRSPYNLEQNDIGTREAKVVNHCHKRRLDCNLLYQVKDMEAIC